MNPSVNARTAKIIAIVYALLCHGAFAVAVAAMAWSLLNGMQVGWGRLHGAAAWAANAFLLLQFPIAHSLLLTARGRRIIGRLAPAPFAADLATTTYVAIASIQVALVFVLWSPSGVVWWAATGWLRWTLITAFVGSWLLLATAMFDAGLGVQMGYLLGGTVIAESVFALPGIGRLVLTAVLNRDYQVATGIIFLIATAFVLINLVVDMIYPILDPRVRLSRSGG